MGFCGGVVAGYFLAHLHTDQNQELAKASIELSKQLPSSDVNLHNSNKTSVPPNLPESTISKTVLGNGESQNNITSDDEQMQQSLAQDQRVLAANLVMSRAQVEGFSEMVRKLEKENRNPLEYAGTKFAAEPVNYEWAATKEDEILGAFESQDDLKEIVPLSVQCKTENCQIVIAVENSSQAEEFSSKFTRALSAEAKQHGLSSVSYFVDPDAGELIFYLSENFNKGILN